MEGKHTRAGRPEIDNSLNALFAVRSAVDVISQENDYVAAAEGWVNLTRRGLQRMSAIDTLTMMLDFNHNKGF